MIEPKKAEEHEPPLTQAQLAALPLLASGAKKKDAAAAAGVCPQTISEWLSLSHFRGALLAKHKDLSALAATRLADTVDAAVSTVLEVMQTANEPTRLKAAMFILDRMLAMESRERVLPDAWEELSQAEEKAVEDAYRTACEILARLEVHSASDIKAASAIEASI